MGLGASDVPVMTEQPRDGLVAKTPGVELTGEVGIDAVYVAAVAKRGDRAGAAS